MIEPNRKEKKYSKAWYAVGLLVAANLAVWSIVLKQQNRGFTELEFFNIGQGDSSYIRTVQGNDILIDGGPGDGVLSKLGQVLPFADRQIEFIVVTHPHADHVTGIVEVLKKYRVGKVLITDVAHDSAIYGKLLELLQEKNIPVVHPKLGQRIFLDDYTVLDIFYPISGVYEKAPKDVNIVSTIARLTFGSQHVLFTGDAGKDQEDFLMSAGLPLGAQILKIGHQGSKTSTGEKFLAEVHPDYGVIMVGKNSYGHPHEITLNTLDRQQVKVLRTDEEGDIKFRLYPDHVELIEN